MLLWGYSFTRAIPCITGTTFKYQILPIRFCLSNHGGVHSTVFSTGQGDFSRQTDGTWEKVWIRYKCRNGNPLETTLLILAPTFMVCLVPYSVWIMNRLRVWLCKAMNTEYSVIQCNTLWGDTEIKFTFLYFSMFYKKKLVCDALLLNWMQVGLHISLLHKLIQMYFIKAKKATEFKNV